MPITAANTAPAEITTAASTAIAPATTAPSAGKSASKKRREPEGGFDREPTDPNGRRKTNSSAEEELLRLAEDHLQMIEEEQAELDAEKDPVELLEESFNEVDLNNKPPSMMTRLAAKMLEVAEAKKKLEAKKNGNVEIQQSRFIPNVPTTNPFSQASRAEHQRNAPQGNPFAMPLQRQQQ